VFIRPFVPCDRGLRFKVGGPREFKFSGIISCDVMVLALESRHKGNNVPYFRNPVEGEERMRSWPLVGVIVLSFF